MQSNSKIGNLIKGKINISSKPFTSVENILQISFFLQNKANLKIGKMSLSIAKIKHSKNLWLYKSLKNKPNPPIVQIALTSFIAMNYVIFVSLTKVKNKAKTNPIQSQSNPIQTQLERSASPELVEGSPKGQK